MGVSLAGDMITDAGVITLAPRGAADYAQSCVLKQVTRLDQ